MAGIALLGIAAMIAWYVFVVSNRTVFTNADFTLSLPRGWKEETSARDFKQLGIEAVKFNHDNPFASIVIQKEPQKSTAVDFVATQKSLREKYPKEFRDYKEIESHVGTFAGYDTLFFNYEFTFEGKKRGTYRAEQNTMVILVRDTVYHVSIFLPRDASASLRRHVDTMLHSLKFL